MANIKQQKKRIGISQRQRMENLRYKSTIRTLFRALQANVDAGDSEAAAVTHRSLVQLLDRSAQRNAMHRNTVARRKALASRMLLQEPKQETAVTRRGKKKPGARKPQAAKATKAPEATKPAEAATEAAPAKAAKPDQAADETADTDTTDDASSDA